jgi:hypothetical protein
MLRRSFLCNRFFKRLELQFRGLFFLVTNYEI